MKDLIILFILYIILSIIIYLIIRCFYRMKLRQQAAKYEHELTAREEQFEARQREKDNQALSTRLQEAHARQDQEIAQRYRSLETQFQLDSKDKQLKLAELAQSINIKNQELQDARKQLQSQADHAKEWYETYLKDFYNSRLQYYETCYDQALQNEKTSILDDIQHATDDAINRHNIKINELTLAYQEQLDLLNELKLTVAQYATTVHAINEAKASEEKMNADADFYRICLTDEVKQDVELLQRTKSMLSNHTLIDKLIYDCYIAKPTLEMTRRVLDGSKPCGVYKITNIRTQKVYIGQSTDIANRWTGHIKSAFGLEGVADSIFQRALKSEGVDNFTFEVIEKCEKSELRDKERFWINFYESNIYGYNMRSEAKS